MKNPRIQVSVDPELHEIIRRISVGTGQSSSGFVSALLNEQREVLSQVAHAIDQARSLSRPLSGRLTVSLAKTDDNLTGALHDAQMAFDQLSLDLAQEKHEGGEGRTVPQAARGAASAARPLPDPLTINKGVYTKGVKSK